MLEPALFRHDRVPSDVLDLPYDRLPVEVRELHSVRCNDGEIAIREKEKIAGVIENRGHIGSYEILIFAQTDNCWRTISSSDDLVGLIHRNHGQREHST